jgi:hypothetical protein
MATRSARRVNNNLKSLKKNTKNLKDRLNTKYDNIDVTKLEDVDKLVQHIKHNVVTLLLIYADWCGHCGTFKEEVWKKLAALKGRKVAMAQINEKMLASTPFADTKIDGYPTNMLVGKDMKPAVFKDETGESTNSMPNTRNLPVMTKLVKANPSQVMAENSIVTPLEASAIPTPEVEAKMDEEGTNIMNTLKSGQAIEVLKPTESVPNPPNVEDDILSTQIPPKKPLNGGGSLYKSVVEGSLYRSLVEAARGGKTRRQKKVSFKTRKR